MPEISTTVTGDVREFHFRCTQDHEFSVLAKTEVVSSLPCCVVEGCSGWSWNIADNPAEVSKNATDLLEH